VGREDRNHGTRGQNRSFRNSFRVVTVSNLRDGDEIAVDEEGAEMANLHAVQTEAARFLVDLARHAIWTKADGMFGRPMAVEVRDESARPPGAAYRKKPAEHAGRSEVRNRDLVTGLKSHLEEPTSRSNGC
jgi:hypothetical protein